VTQTILRSKRTHWVLLNPCKKSGRDAGGLMGCINSTSCRDRCMLTAYQIAASARRSLCSTNCNDVDHCNLFSCCIFCRAAATASKLSALDCTCAQSTKSSSFSSFSACRLTLGNLSGRYCCCSKSSNTTTVRTRQARCRCWAKCFHTA